MSAHLQDYWTHRGEGVITYRGETFYTITPVAHYVRRRRHLLHELKRDLAPHCLPGRQCIDFGCGDGRLMSLVSESFPGLQWTGIDISPTMIERARKEFPYARYAPSLEHASQAGVILCIAVLAHIVDSQTCARVCDSLAAKLDHTGILVLFEQTAPEVCGSSVYLRRPASYYTEEFEKRGFILTRHTLFHYSAHIFFEKHLAKRWYRFLAKGSTNHDRRLAANHSLLFRMLSAFFTTISPHPVRPPDPEKWGYAYLVFQKKQP